MGASSQWTCGAAVIVGFHLRLGLEVPLDDIAPAGAVKRNGGARMWKVISKLFHRRSRLARTGISRQKRMKLRSPLAQWLQLRLRGVWLHWDRYPQDGTLIRPFCGVIEVRGWAVAADGVRSVEVYCADRLLGTAAIGLRRRDLFYQFPHIRSSRRGGFQYVFDTSRVPNGRHELMVLARSNRGRTARLSAAIYIHNLATHADRLDRRTTFASNEQSVVLVRAPYPLIELKRIRSILLVKLDHLGDVLLTIPVMRRLREIFPEARITALVGSWARPLLELEPCIDEVLTYDFFLASSA